MSHFRAVLVPISSTFYVHVFVQKRIFGAKILYESTLHSFVIFGAKILFKNCEHKTLMKLTACLLNKLLQNQNLWHTWLLFDYFFQPPLLNAKRSIRKRMFSHVFVLLNFVDLTIVDKCCLLLYTCNNMLT